MEKINLLPSENEYGLRLDVFIASRLSSFTRSAIQKLIEKGLVTSNGKPLPKSHKVSSKEIQVVLPLPEPSYALPQDIPLSILYEDECLLVLDKPKGLVVHPGAGNHDGTLVNAVLYHCSGQLSGIGGVMRPGIVHRLDKDTSGLILVAKTDAAHQSLSRQLSCRTLTRIYHCIAVGTPKSLSASIDAPIGRHPVHRKRMAAGLLNGRPALTYYTVLEKLNGHSYIECRLVTGRTHQIRVHMAFIGHPLLGDNVYGNKKSPFSFLEGQCLHAKTLAFDHPLTGSRMEITSPLPEYFTKALELTR